MTTRVEELRSQMQGFLKQAVIQMEGARGTVIRTVAGRLDVDINALRSRRDAVLRRLGKESERLIQQDKVPLPTVVRQTLGRVNELLDQWLDASQIAGTSGGHDAAEDAVAVEADVRGGEPVEADSTAKPSKRRTGRSRAAAAKGSRNGAGRKPRRQGETHHS